MKFSKIKASEITSLVALLLLQLPLGSCDFLGKDMEPKYWYNVHNRTQCPIEVALEPANAQVSGDRYLRRTVAPGETEAVWARTGSEEDGRVVDFEKNLQSISEFKAVLILRDGAQLTPRDRLTDPKKWEYKQIKGYEASYTLTLSEGDFY